MEDRFLDLVVIYKEYGKWVAHSVETDQIGVDDDIVKAVAGLIKAVESVLQLADEDPTIMSLRKAPQEIIDKAHKATRLPNSIYDLACDYNSGTFPTSDFRSSALYPKKDKAVFSISGIKPRPCHQV